MVNRRRTVVAVLAFVICLGIRPFTPDIQLSAEALPSRLSDKAFWQLVNQLSEANDTDAAAKGRNLLGRANVK